MLVKVRGKSKSKTIFVLGGAIHLKGEIHPFHKFLSKEQKKKLVLNLVKQNKKFSKFYDE